MENQDWKQELEKSVEQINTELLNLSKEGLPEWRRWFDRGKKPICGVQVTYYLALYPKKRKEFLDRYAQILKEKSEGKTIGDLKDGLSEVFSRLIKSKKAIGFSDESVFIEKLQVLTISAINKILESGPQYKNDSFVDKRTGNLIESTIIDLNSEDEWIETIDEYKKIQSLKEQEQGVVIMHKDGCSEREIESATGINRSTVRNIIRRFQKHLEE